MRLKLNKGELSTSYKQENPKPITRPAVGAPGRTQNTPRKRAWPRTEQQGLATHRIRATQQGPDLNKNTPAQQEPICAQHTRHPLYPKHATPLGPRPYAEHTHATRTQPRTEQQGRTHNTPHSPQPYPEIGPTCAQKMRHPTSLTPTEHALHSRPSGPTAHRTPPPQAPAVPGTGHGHWVRPIQGSATRLSGRQTLLSLSGPHLFKPAGCSVFCTNFLYQFFCRKKLY